MKGRGYILLEVTVGVAIAAFVALSSFAVLRAHALGVRAAYEEAVAREVAGARLERFEATAWDGLRDGVTEEAVDDPGWENLEAGRCSVTVKPDAAGTRAVEVEVSWEGTPGRRRSIRLRTLAWRLP